MMKPTPIAVLSLMAVALSALLPAGSNAANKDELSPLQLARKLNQAFVEVADSVAQSVVVLKVTHRADYVDANEEENPLFEMLPPEFRRRMDEQREERRRDQERQRRFHREPFYDGEGSGVVIRKEGYILTNRHVVDGADKIKVRFKDGSEFDATVRGVDAQSDVAVIKIDPKGKELKVARLADSDKTRVGEFAIAIGAPFELDYSVTFGHVSAKGRSGILRDERADQDFLQTDANINPGNSGGPLVNIDGEVIGINTLIHGLRSGIGFAIPSNLAGEIADRLITDGKFVRAYLGVRIGPLKGENEYRDLITGVSDGVLVTEIPPEGPAAKSDLKPGDFITAVEGRPVGTAQQLKNEIRGRKIGEPVTLDVHRFGKNIKVKVKPGAWPEETAPIAARRSTRSEDHPTAFGLSVESVTDELAEHYGIGKVAGVLVTEVEQDTAAAETGIRPGDVITEVAGKVVSTSKQFWQAIKAADPKKGVVILYTSRGTNRMGILKDSGE
jgi:serine protease Do